MLHILTQAKYTFRVLLIAIKALILLKGGLVVSALDPGLRGPGWIPVRPGTLSCILCHVFTKSKL